MAAVAICEIRWCAFMPFCGVEKLIDCDAGKPFPSNCTMNQYSTIGHVF